MDTGHARCLTISCVPSTPDVPLAYFLTWSTYGSRLHGDQRGSVERANRNPNLTTYESRPNLESFERNLLHAPIMRLDQRSQQVVLSTFREVSQFRHWRLWAAHIRTEHVHVVIEAEARPEKVVVDLKARATRLLREAGLIGKDQQLWTQHASTRHLWNLDSLERAIHYTLHEQGEPMAMFDGRET